MVAEEKVCRRDERRKARAARERDGETRQQESRDEETGTGPGSLAEVLGCQSGMDARADRADEDHDIAFDTTHSGLVSLSQARLTGVASERSPAELARDGLGTLE